VQLERFELSDENGSLVDSLLSEDASELVQQEVNVCQFDLLIAGIDVSQFGF
jgi:hypothetical protein